MNREPEVNEYHWRDGWTFKRVDITSGDVRIRTSSGEEVVIPAPEWASIVAAVSAAVGFPMEHAPAFQVALGLHTLTGYAGDRAAALERQEDERYLRSVADHWQGKANYWRGIVDQLSDEAASSPQGER